MILFLLLWEVCLFDLFSTFKTWLKGQRSQKTSSHLCGVWKGWLEGNLILQIFLKKTHSWTQTRDLSRPQNMYTKIKI